MIYVYRIFIFYFKKKYFVLPILLFLLACDKQENVLTIDITGDIILDRGVKDQIELHGSYLLDSSIRNFKEGDLMLVNYEGAFTSTKTKQKDQYNFKANPLLASNLHDAGITHISLANNHSFDYLQKGFEETHQVISKHNMVAIGVDCKVEIIDHKGIKVGLIASSLVNSNDHLCLSDKEKLKKLILDFKLNEPNIPIFLYIHWGSELQSSPEEWQRDFADELIKIGVDGIFGHHPHVIQTIEFIDNKPVIYSLGNFIADAYLPGTKSGLIAHIEIKNGTINTYINFIKLDRFFPSSAISNDLYENAFRSKYFNSNICIIPSGNKWLLRPSDNVVFREAFNEWYFYTDEALVMVKRISPEHYLFRIAQKDSVSQAISVYGRLSELEIADINDDGFVDVLLGITKKVKFDAHFNKRIQIYTLKNRILQPLWLGTKFIDEVISFNIECNEGVTYLKIKEKTNNGQILIRKYVWEEFGFALNK